MEEVKSGEAHLTVRRLIPEDTGNYTCRSTNKADISEKNATLTVYCKKSFESEK